MTIQQNKRTVGSLPKLKDTTPYCLPTLSLCFETLLSHTVDSSTSWAGPNVLTVMQGSLY